jgi:GntP family gluconate:H+ symporter
LRPTFTVTLGTVLLPVVLMLGKAIADVVDSKGHGVAKRSLDFIGTPLIALLIAVLVAMVTLGRGAGLDKEKLAKVVEQSLPHVTLLLAWFVAVLIRLATASATVVKEYFGQSVGQTIKC